MQTMTLTPRVRGWRTQGASSQPRCKPAVRQHVAQDEFKLETACYALAAGVINRNAEIVIVCLHVSDGAQEEEAAEDDHCVRAGRCTFLI